MTRRIVANVLMVIGAWYGAVFLSYWLTVALIPINTDWFMRVIPVSCSCTCGPHFHLQPWPATALEQLLGP